uniref:Uncharacterized protein n=1 Tax=mine drainage metagenome TaxID=410659 RepID=E6PZS1_9ZZZZ
MDWISVLSGWREYRYAVVSDEMCVDFYDFLVRA